jgi:phosphatidylinositol alpha-1,6-mannosyltransferase
MKVLFITPGCFDKGGISRYSRYQINALREIFGSKQVKVLSLLGPGEGDFETPFEVDWHGKGNGFFSKVKLMLRIGWLLLTWRPHVVHTAHLNFSGFTYTLAKIFGAFTILNVYGLEVWSRPSWDALFGLRKTDLVISDCYYTASYIYENKLRPKGNIEVIWDCVDLEIFYPAVFKPEIIDRYKLPDPNQFFSIVSLGRLSKTAAHKGYDRLIGVFSKLAAEFPQARLVIAGKGDNVEYYKSLAKELMVQDKVVFTGMVLEEDLPDIYRFASVFSLVSDRGLNRGEGIPLTPLEAMSCGTPIIVGNQDGSQEAVVNETNGYVIDPLDLDLHAKCIKELISTPGVLAQKKQAAVKIAHANFSYTGFLEKHRALYKKIENS